MILTDEQKRKCVFRRNYTETDGICLVCKENCLGKENCLCKYNMFDCVENFISSNFCGRGIVTKMDVKYKAFPEEAFNGFIDGRIKVDYYSTLYDFLRQWVTDENEFSKDMLPEKWKLIRDEKQEYDDFLNFKKRNPNYLGDYPYSPRWMFVKDKTKISKKELCGLPVISWDVEENSCCQNNKNGISW